MSSDMPGLPRPSLVVPSIGMGGFPHGQSANGSDLLGVPGRDPQWDRTRLLVQANYPYENATIVDTSSTRRVVTVAGGVDLTRAATNNNNLSIHINGSASSYLSCASSTDLDFGTGDFTLEMFVNPFVISSYIMQRRTFDGLGAGEFAWGYTTFYDWSTVTLIAQLATSPPLGTWSHLAAERYNGVITLYLNGVAGGSGASTRDYTCSKPLYIGYNDDANHASINGYLDQIRVTIGRARYKGNFIVPRRAFPNG